MSHLRVKSDTRDRVAASPQKVGEATLLTTYSWFSMTEDFLQICSASLQVSSNFHLYATIGCNCGNVDYEITVQMRIEYYLSKHDHSPTLLVLFIINKCTYDKMWLYWLCPTYKSNEVQMHLVETNSPSR